MMLINLHLLLRLTLGALLLSTGGAKLVHPHRFRRNIEDYQLIPRWVAVRFPVAAALAWIIPVLELLIGLGLIGDVAVMAAPVALLILLVVFSGAVAINLVRGRTDLSCHCAGVLGDHRIAWWQVARNGALMLCAVVVVITPADPFLLVPLATTTSGAPNGAWITTFLPMALIVGLIMVCWLIVMEVRHRPAAVRWPSGVHKSALWKRRC
ncbi:MAG TPA: MauE/DoxX family redox-associated membrane protein [Ktedonobacterales bacterium]|nr:MauE/DoxX family redox-associated membrane protein [Ktedonobacterales bacterium]